MAWPTDAVATGELITAAQLNGLPVRIANTTLSASAASITFASIPGHYAHLLLELYMRVDQAVTAQIMNLRLNNDTGANYDHQYVVGNAATASAAETFASTVMSIASVPGASAAANLFGGAEVMLPHYANSANNKTAVSLYANKSGTASGNMTVGSFAAFWRSSAAVTTVQIIPTGGGNLVSGSRATLYGVA